MRRLYTKIDLGKAYNPPGSATTYNYNPDNQLTSIARPDWKTIFYNYDVGGRLDKLTVPHGQISYAYDNVTGNLNTIKALDGGTFDITYDGFLPLKTTWSGSVSGSVSRTYNNNFLETSRSVNGANGISFSYDPDDFITQAGRLSITRETQNGFITDTVIDKIGDSISYNSFGEPTGYTAAFDGTDFYSTAYTRDKLGRITQKTETANGATHTYEYAYEKAGWLSEVRKNGTVVSQYQYDSNGNRLSLTKHGSVINGTYDVQDRNSSYGNYTFTYTGNGELASRRDTGTEAVTTYQYDVFGSLLSVTMPDSTVIDYVIDGMGRRVGKKIDGTLVQGFLYKDLLNPIAEIDDVGNVISRFIYGSKPNISDYMEKGGNAYRIITDHLGSPVLVVDITTGKVMQQMEYDEFGNVVSDTNPGFQPFGFVGGIYDQDTKLTRFGYRDYYAYTGRWTAKDPIRFNSGNTNLYGYVQNNPTNLVDLTGYQGEHVCNNKCPIKTITEKDLLEDPDFCRDTSFWTIRTTRRVFPNATKKGDKIVVWREISYSHLLNTAPGREYVFVNGKLTCLGTENKISPAIGKTDKGNCLFGLISWWRHSKVDKH
jgi:Rhs family protein